MASKLLTRIPPLFADLAKVIAGDIDCSQETLHRYAVDSSPYFILPQAVFYPKNTTDIKHILAFAREYTIPVTVRGGGSGRSGGGLGEGLIIDTTRYFNHIRNITMTENTITVDAGVTVSSLLERLQSWKYDIPLLERTDNTTIGALVATRPVQKSSHSHGSIREWIESITVVVDNGEEHVITDGVMPSGRLLGIYQAIFPLLSQSGGVLRGAKPKSNDDGSGYNLWSTSIGPRQLLDQLSGSEGTLAIITSVTFRITPHKPYSRTTYIPLADKKLLPSCINLAKEHKADSIYLYDEAYMELADRYRRNAVPFFPDIPYTLMVTHTNLHKEELEKNVSTFIQSLPIPEYSLITSDNRETVLETSNESFLLTLCDEYTNKTLTPNMIASGLLVTINQLPSFLAQLETYLHSLGKLYSITGNVASGHISVITLFDSKAKYYDEELVSYAKHIFSIVKEYDGGINAEGGEGIARAPFVLYRFNDQTLKVFEAVKDAWDPLHIFNPGKKLGTTTGYLTNHLKH